MVPFASLSWWRLCLSSDPSWPGPYIEVRDDPSFCSCSWDPSGYLGILFTGPGMRSPSLDPGLLLGWQWIQLRGPQAL